MSNHSTAELATRIRHGDRAALARALNILDNRLPAQRESSQQLLDAVRAGGIPVESHMIGITGPPGVGKSSLTAALIQVWRERGRTVGVLAVDPSSPISGGALLGDRLRMHAVAQDDGVFIRSLSSRGEFGGLSAEVWPMGQLMLTAFDVVLVETVGVGQREIDVSMLCDTTCFVAQPGSGDSIQLLKAGILEVPHVLVVNKYDMGAVADRTLAEFTAALATEHADGNWRVPVLATSATQHTGIEALVDALDSHHTSLIERGTVAAKRLEHQARWIIKRLGSEFGSAGIARLGGEKNLLASLSEQDSDPFDCYIHYRQRLGADSH
tara:strand:+ start:76773 stop:77747 length:975 start_codon:yes stop_codon:yes gene_type:complete